MMLKNKKPSDQFPEGICCIRRCSDPVEVIIDAGAMRLPLCDDHWEKHCAEDEEQTAEQA